LKINFTVWFILIGGIWILKVCRVLVKLIVCVDDVITTVLNIVESTKV